MLTYSSFPSFAVDAGLIPAASCRSFFHIAVNHELEEFFIGNAHHNRQADKNASMLPAILHSKRFVNIGNIIHDCVDCLINTDRRIKNKAIVLTVVPMFSGNMVIIGAPCFIRTAYITFCLCRCVAIYLHYMPHAVLDRSMNKYTNHIAIVSKHIACGSANDDATTIVGNPLNDFLLCIDSATYCASAQIKVTKQIGRVFMNV